MCDFKIVYEIRMGSYNTKRRRGSRRFDGRFGDFAVQARRWCGITCVDEISMYFFMIGFSLSSYEPRALPALYQVQKPSSRGIEQPDTNENSD
jgi:hypothetical protein